MPDIPDIVPQKALWYSLSKKGFIRVCDMKDRHLLGAIGVEKREARISYLNAENRDRYDTWHDFINPIYIALVKEALSRYLEVPNEDDQLRLMELSVQYYIPSEEEQKTYMQLYPDDEFYFDECKLLLDKAKEQIKKDLELNPPEVLEENSST